MLKSANDFDVIVIGSGMGGLTTASLLAQLGKRRVLVLERHFKLGGFTHSFRRGPYEWDAGVHYVGEMSEGTITRRLMDLVTRRGVQWHPMSTPFEEFIFPTGRFAVPSDPKEYRRLLLERFPLEAAALRQYFRDVQAAQHWVVRWFVAKVYGPRVLDCVTYFNKHLATMTTEEYMSRFRDPLLKAILTAQWPDFGSPPQESAFGFHATVSADFFHGGYYPVGGAKQIAVHASRAIEACGGRCLVNQQVETVLVRNGKAYGVIADHHGEKVEYRAPVIVSNIGAYNTFNHLVPDDYCSEERAQTKRLRPGPSALIVFLGLKDDPRTHGYTDRNYWMYSRLDHDTQARFRDGQPDRIDGAFLSFGSLRNPGQTPHTAQIITLTDEKPWSEYRDTEWRRRGSEYENQKQITTHSLVDYVEGHLPGLKSMISYQELSTPLSVNSFTGHLGGAIYGQACDPNRLVRDRWMIDTSLPNLYLTGSDTGSPGVNGALVAGAMTAARLLGPMGLGKVMGAAYVWPPK